MSAVGKATNLIIAFALEARQLSLYSLGCRVSAHGLCLGTPRFYSRAEWCEASLDLSLPEIGWIAR